MKLLGIGSRINHAEYGKALSQMYPQQNIG
jgi:hypothetical protein